MIIKLATTVGKKNDSMNGKIKAAQVTLPGIISKKRQRRCFLIMPMFDSVMAMIYTNLNLLLDIFLTVQPFPLQFDEVFLVIVLQNEESGLGLY